METHEIVLAFAKVVASFEYGHTSVPWGHFEGIDFYWMPYHLKQFKDGLFI